MEDSELYTSTVISSDNGLDAARVCCSDDELVTDTLHILWSSSLEFEIEALDKPGDDEVHLCPGKAG